MENKMFQNDIKAATTDNSRFFSKAFGKNLLLILISFGVLSSCSFLKRLRGGEKTKANVASKPSDPAQGGEMQTPTMESLSKENQLLKSRIEQLEEEKRFLLETAVNQDAEADLNQGTGKTSGSQKEFSSSGGKAFTESEIQSQQQIRMALQKYAGALKADQDGNLEQAKQAYQLLMTSDVEQVRARSLYQLARLEKNAGNFQGALNLAEKIIQGESHSSVVLDGLGIALDCAKNLNLQDKVAIYQNLIEGFRGQ